MPIYYKKVNLDSNELGLMESGLETSSSASGNGNGGFFSGVGKKLTQNFGSPTLLFSNGGSNNSEVELEKISTSFLQDIDDSHLEDLNLGDNSNYSYNGKGPFLLQSKTVNSDRDRLMTKFGPIVVVKQLPPNMGVISESIVNQVGTSTSAQKPSPSPRPVIITYHDVGFNYFSNFESFFTRMNIKQLLQDFRIYHVNAPGQEEEADDLPHVGFKYPSMEELAEQVVEVCKYYGIEEFIGIGYGAGANILSRVALSNADLVEALFLINPSATTSTWSEWFYQKLNCRAIFQLEQQAQSQVAGTAGNAANRTSNNKLVLPQSVKDYFLWHLFGNTSLPDRVMDKDAINFYRRYFESDTINPHNLSLFIESFIGRTALGISREDKLNNFKCPVAVICGDYSPHVDESVRMNGRLDPTTSTWMKLADCAMVLEEQPNKVAEVLRLFLQGLGYTLKRALQNEKSFLTGKSMPCLSYPNNNDTRHSQLRQGFMAGIKEV